MAFQINLRAIAVLSSLSTLAVSIIVAPHITRIDAQQVSQIVVNSLSDDASVCQSSRIMCLRNALTEAAGLNRPVNISFSVSGKIDLAAKLVIDFPRSPVTIDGSNQFIVIDGGQKVHLFTIDASSSLTLDNILNKRGR